MTLRPDIKCVQGISRRSIAAFTASAREDGRLRRDIFAGCLSSRAAMLAVLLAGGLLQACAVSDNPLTLFADPGKYQYNTCEQIAGQKKTWSSRELELRQLMDKAEQSTGGAVVNVLAYKADHVAALEELKVLEATARSKNCNPPDNWRSNTVVR
jgi:hypothetical protein